MIYDQVAWGFTMCDLCRSKPADLLAEGEPLCISCADLTLERMAVTALGANVLEGLPTLFEQVGRGK